MNTIARWHSSPRDALFVASVAAALLIITTVTAVAGERRKVMIRSTADGSMQPCYVITPKSLPDGSRDDDTEPVAMLVSLHSWSAGLEQRNKTWEEEAERRGWIYLFPHFRGPNNRPRACGSPLAQQDILDAVAWAIAELPVDRRRIYLGGSSGGGHMTMLMAGRYPKVWAAASAWVGISDLADWHAFHDARKSGYDDMMRRCCGGRPGDSVEVDRQYKARSPLTYLAAAVDLPLDIAAGVNDGHTGSVPIRHSLKAFNTAARAKGAAAVSKEEIAQLSQRNGRLKNPRDSDRVSDATLGREIYLRRMSGKTRVTIFDGGHESVAASAGDWLARHKRATPAELPLAK